MRISCNAYDKLDYISSEAALITDLSRDSFIPNFFLTMQTARFI